MCKLSNLGLIACLLGIPLFSLGCEKANVQSPTGAGYIKSDSGLGVTVRGAGITVKFGPNLSYESKTTLVGSESTTVVLVGGEQFVLGADQLTLGGRVYSGLKDGDQIVISEEGVFVNDGLRHPE